MTHLADRSCTPSTAETPALTPHRIEELLPQLDAWRVDDKGHLARAFHFRNFREAFELVARIADIADAEDHHPEIRLGWGHVEIELWTHVAGGLTESDFIVAAKIDRIAAP